MNDLKELRKALQERAVSFMKKNWPHYTFFVVVILAYTLLASGCTTADSSFIRTNYEASQRFGGDLIDYLMSDETFKSNEEEREMRVKSIESWQESCKAAYESHIAKSGNGESKSNNNESGSE